MAKLCTLDLFGTHWPTQPERLWGRLEVIPRLFSLFHSGHRGKLCQLLQGQSRCFLRHMYHQSSMWFPWYIPVDFEVQIRCNGPTCNNVINFSSIDHGRLATAHHFRFQDIQQVVSIPLCRRDLKVPNQEPWYSKLLNQGCHLSQHSCIGHRIQVLPTLEVH